MESEIDYILRIAKEKEGGDKLYFLLNKTAVMMYLAMADEIKRILGKGKILDWGCGYGQLSYLLKRRGFEVMSYDINREEELNRVRSRFGIDCVSLNEHGGMAGAESDFDAVVACGVLEHVADEAAALRRIFRALSINGYFFIYMLPNLYSYTEFIAARRAVGAHAKKYRKQQIKKILTDNGFKILKISYGNALPKNLTKVSGLIPDVYNRFYKTIVRLDNILTKVFPINIFSGVYSVVCQKI